ncbi:sulfite exporter TauE/SafE family protein [Microtetraspora niveoalba]|uniref:sulfite exporter TauE/SafE family protein n=1 Tax=Microtetraspora niveoalba TaxID=46175 RepID=UPI001C3F30A4|nr:sulfite exporter TauE/SafE family protein [Microtetraspora niveoalba]
MAHDFRPPGHAAIPPYGGVLMEDLSLPLLVLLGLFGFAGGVGITALGPGGVLPTIGLFALTGLSPAEVAGTAIVTHVATGALATAAYTRSGQLRDPATRRTALLLAGTAVVGTPLGVLVNTMVSTRAFGLTLGLLLVLVAALVWIRERRGPAAGAVPPTPLVAGLGLAVAVAAGVVGIGGPMLTVPLLIVLGVPVLESLASAQVQSVVVAAVGTLGYLAHDAVDWPLAALVGVPELAGVLIGWKIAHALPARGLKYGLIVALLALAPYLALHG